MKSASVSVFFVLLLLLLLFFFFFEKYKRRHDFFFFFLGLNISYHSMTIMDTRNQPLKEVSGLSWKGKKIRDDYNGNGKESKRVKIIRGFSKST